MTDRGWPGPTATMAKAAVGPTTVKPTRMELVHRIAELMGRYRVAQSGKKVRILDMENAGAVLPAEYENEDHAKAGARLQAAYDIYDLFTVAKS